MKEKSVMEASNSEPLNVYIRCDNKGCRVDPGEIDVEDQNTVRFHNKTTGIVRIVFSEEKLFPEPKIKIDKGKEYDLIVRKVQRGIYPFAAYCEATNDFCSASSMPIIIIRR
jgi:hypothetical protein